MTSTQRNYLDGGEAVLEALRRLGVDYIMSSPGSEMSPIWEALARQKVADAPGPTFIDCWHEMVAVDMALGYTAYTGRMQAVLLSEAFRLVGEGYVSAEDLDKTIRDGLGLRWSFMGPFETIELNAPGGIADYCERYTGFYKRLAAAPAGPEVYARRNTDKVSRGWGEPLTPERHATKTRWRDERLAALVAHKRTQKGFKK